MSLDIEVTQDADGEWHVWTPDETGGIIGSGPTEERAREQAALNCVQLAAELFKPKPE